MRPIVVGAAAVALLLALTAIGAVVSLTPTVLAIAWVAFLAMAGGIWLGHRRAGSAAGNLVWGYGLASGAMIASAAAFLVPGAVGHQAALGGFGIAAGVVTGYAAHTIGHRLTHLETVLDDTTVRLVAHGLAAGAIIGLVYAASPTLGPLLGLAIVSHKGPAGYAAARRLTERDRPVGSLLVAAASVGLAAIPVALTDLSEVPAVSALVFGFAAGIFLHLAMDFLPRCEVGGEVYDLAMIGEGSHAVLDRLRLHAVASTALGSLAVFVAWLAVGGAA